MITQTDLILRSALIAGLKDLRAKPYLIDDIFSQAAQDTLLQQEFGYAEIARVKKWFLGINVPVVMQHRLDSVELPCISIALMSSGERTGETYLGDFGDNEEIDDTQVFSSKTAQIEPVVILGPFSPKAYDPATGLITLPDALTTEWLFPGQLLVDRKHNTAYSILTVVDLQTFTIAEDTVADFSDAIVMPRYQTMSLTRERAMFSETYQIGCHVSGDAVELLWLHSIVVFCLQRYKQSLLDGRGLTRTTFSSSDFVKNPAYEGQNVYSRYVTMTAVVENNWIASVNQKLEGIVLDSLRVMDGGTTPEQYYDEIKDQGWVMDDDPVDA
jgi:hypothetical protein